MGLPTANRFAEKDAAAAKAKPPKPKNAKAKGMGGLEASRNPMPQVGTSRFRLLEVEEGINPKTNRSSLKMKVEALNLAGSPHEAGDEFTLVFMRTLPGERDYKQAVAGFAGYSAVDEYDAFDPNGELFSALVGEDNDFNEEAAALIGRVCDVKVSRGGDVVDKTTNQSTGDFYRAYKWTPVGDDDDDQDVSPKIVK